MLIPVVKNKQELGRVTQAQVRRQRMANKAASVVQALNALLYFFVTSRNFDEHSGDLAVRGHDYFVDRHQPDPRIFQLALDQRGDLFAQSFTAAGSKIFLGSVFHLS